MLMAGLVHNIGLRKLPMCMASHERFNQRTAMHMAKYYLYVLLYQYPTQTPLFSLGSDSLSDVRKKNQTGVAAPHAQTQLCYYAPSGFLLRYVILCAIFVVFTESLN